MMDSGLVPGGRPIAPAVATAAAGLLLLLAGSAGCAGAHRPRVRAVEVPPPAAKRADLRTTPSPAKPSAPPVAEFDWPVPGGLVLSGFGAPRANRIHEGIDIGAPAGESVIATQSGRVVYSGATMRGYGKTVIVDHGEGLHSLYAHNSALLVGAGDWVERGQPIARVGRSGNATAEHCHFEMRLLERPVDPMGYLEPRRVHR